MIISSVTWYHGCRQELSGRTDRPWLLSLCGYLPLALDAPDPLKQILYGAIVVLLAALYVRTTGDNG